MFYPYIFQLIGFFFFFFFKTPFLVHFSFFFPFFFGGLPFTRLFSVSVKLLIFWCIVLCAENFYQPP